MLHIHITKSGIFTGNSLGFLAISDAMRWFSAAAKAPYWKWGPSLPSPLSYFLYQNSILPSRDTLVITWVVDIISGKCCAIALTWNNKLACHDWEFVHIYRWMVLAAVDHSRLTEPIININEIKVVGMEAEKNDAHSNWHASQFLVTFAATLQSCRFSLSSII